MFNGFFIKRNCSWFVALKFAWFFNSQLNCWFRFVDDNFVLLPHNITTLNKFLEHLNGILCSLQVIIVMSYRLFVSKIESKGLNLDSWGTPLVTPKLLDLKPVCVKLFTLWFKLCLYKIFKNSLTCVTVVL